MKTVNNKAVIFRHGWRGRTGLVTGIIQISDFEGYGEKEIRPIIYLENRNIGLGLLEEGGEGEKEDRLLKFLDEQTNKTYWTDEVKSR
uniref:Uncharacterized protein n=1 Tax=Arion vulgaris TaxID=1028688 RepID=A0A0B6Y9Y6_9EUPU